LLEKDAWRQNAIAMVSGLAPLMRSEPGYTSNWGILLSEIVAEPTEIVVVGPAVDEIRLALAQHYLPFAVLMGTRAKSDLPLFEGRSATDDKTRIYVCINKTCGLPVETVEEAISQVSRK
jgi:hypothetical protein